MKTICINNKMWQIFFFLKNTYRKMAVNTKPHYSYALVSGWHSRSFSLVTHTPRGAVQIPYGVW